MELLNEEDIKTIVKTCGFTTILKWSLQNYGDKLIGYLGDHLQLKIDVETDRKKLELFFFAKCMPRYDEWKANYLKELNFFKKEYIMLSRLFKEFGCIKGSKKWRPNLLIAKPDIFVFEDVSQLGYIMPCQRSTLTYDEIMATVKTVAVFHAQSYNYEEIKSAELNKPYRIWSEYSEYLQEPSKGQDWRDTGRNAVIDFLKVYSIHKTKREFNKYVEKVIPMLFDGAMTLMRPSPIYRNVVIHRDLWTNNIFLKKLENGKVDALIVDFQTVLYCAPMLDIASLLFFNTTRTFRNTHIDEIINVYYEVLTKELMLQNNDVNTILDKIVLKKQYEESVMFGITQAALIVPIVIMAIEKREELFSNPETSHQINVVSRSNEFIEIAKNDELYRNRVTELFDEIVERYIYPDLCNV